MWFLITQTLFCVVFVVLCCCFWFFVDRAAFYVSVIYKPCCCWVWWSISFSIYVQENESSGLYMSTSPEHMQCQTFPQPHFQPLHPQPKRRLVLTLCSSCVKGVMHLPLHGQFDRLLLKDGTSWLAQRTNEQRDRNEIRQWASWWQIGHLLMSCYEHIKQPAFCSTMYARLSHKDSLAGNINISGL